MKSGKSSSENGQTMRGLTIRQPFPELILRRRKPYEIRSWKTNYRGPLLIHSAAKVKTDCAEEAGLSADILMTSAFVWHRSAIRCASVHASRLQALKPAAGNRRVVARFVFVGTQKADQVCSTYQGKREARTF
jgi:ASCH domain